MERTWNYGIGMSAVVDPAVGDLVIRSLSARGMSTWIARVVEPPHNYALLRADWISECKG